MTEERFERAGRAFVDLCRTMAKLRAPGGCAWDREQTLATLKPYLIEEAYEALEALESGDPRAHCEELGDLLLQIVFQAEITQENGGFDVAAVVHAINEKLVRRHPHVFADLPAVDAQKALKRWESVKATEKAAGTSRLAGVPRAMPGLHRALRVGEKAAAAGFDWPDISGSLDKVAEEWGELQETMQQPEQRAALKHEMGDVLFALVNLCRHLHLDPEEALAGTINRFIKRFGYIEQAVMGTDQPIEKTSLDELNRLWEEAKSHETPLS